MMIARLFGKQKEAPTMRESLDKLQETREMLEKKEKVLQKKISNELQKAKDYSAQKNKRAAIQCLKRKKLYEGQMEALSNFMFRLQDQEVMLEGANATVEVVGVMKGSATVLKNVQKKMNIDDVDKTMDDINEQTENMKQIQDALSQPVGSAAEFDDDELLAELDELDGLELDEQLLEPAMTPSERLPSVPTRTPVAQIATKQPQKVAQKADGEEDDELAALKAEMAL